MQPLKHLDLLNLTNSNNKRWWMWWRDSLIAVKIITCDTYYQKKRPRNTLLFAKTLHITMLLEELGPHLHHQGWPITSNWIFNTRNWFLYILLVVKPYFDFVNIFQGIMSLILFIKCQSPFQGELEEGRIKKPLLKITIRNCINMH